MTRWEYMQLREPDEQKLCTLGDDGWELVSVVWSEGHYCMVAWLKKPRPVVVGPLHVCTSDQLCEDTYGCPVCQKVHEEECT